MMPIDLNVSSDHVRRMIALIDEHSGESLSLATLARALGRQQAYLGRLFRQHMGVSTREYVARVRLERAATMICQGDKVEAVALEVGYRSKKNFYRQFIRHFGTTPAAYRVKASTPHRERLAPREILAGLTFRPIGPAGAGGSIHGISGVPGHPSWFYIASSGGLWKTVNNGTSWTPAFADAPCLGIGAVAVAPSNPEILWIGTGCEAEAGPAGTGLYKSIDGGSTWARAGLGELGHFSRIVVDPHDPDTVYVAGSRPRRGSTLTHGVYRTADGGRTWTRAFIADDTIAVTDLVPHPLDRRVLLAATIRREADVPAPHAVGLPGSLYHTRDGARSWKKIDAPFLPTETGRVQVDRCRMRPEVIYACTQHGDGALLRSGDAGTTWERLTPVDAPSGYEALRVDDENPQRLYLLSDRLYISDDGGHTLQARCASAPRSSRPSIWIDPADAHHVVAAHDGGASVSYDRGDTWQVLRNLSIAHVRQVAVDLQRPYNVYAGLQDAGACFGPSASPRPGGISGDEWMLIPDGRNLSLPDQGDAGTVYTRAADGQFVRFDARTGEHKVIHPEIVDARDIVSTWDGSAPLVISPSSASTIYAGGRAVFKSTDRGVGWTAISPALASPGSNLTALAESALTPGLLYAGTEEGRVFVCREGGPSWTDVTARIAGAPADAIVTRIVSSCHEPETAYVAFDVSRTGDPDPCVFVTADAGRTWTSIAGNLPAGSVRVVRDDPRNPSLLYAGTDSGLFVSSDRGATWTSLKNNLPSVPVSDVVVHPRDNDLIVGTVGRGVWILDDATPLQQLTESVLALGAHLFPIRNAVQSAPRGTGRWPGDDAFVGGNPQPGAVITCWVGETATTGARLVIRDARGAIVREIDGTPRPGIQRMAWDLRGPAPQKYAPSGIEAGAATWLGPFVRPGDYEVTLVVDRKGCGTQRVRVDADPLIDISDAARDLHHRAVAELTEMQNTVRSAAAALDAIWSQLHTAHDRLQRSTIVPGTVCSAGTALVRKVFALRRLVVGHAPRQARKGSPPSARVGALRLTLTARVHGLKADIAGSTSAPTPLQAQMLNRLRHDTTELVEQVNTILTDELPTVNRLIELSGISPARVSARPLPGLPGTSGRRAS